MSNQPKAAERVHKGFIRENDLLIDKNNKHILDKLSPQNRSKLAKHCLKIVKGGLDIVWIKPDFKIVNWLFIVIIYYVKFVEKLF